MGVLIIGGTKNRVGNIKKSLTTLGSTNIYHWDGIKKNSCKRVIPDNVELVVILTDCVNHNAMRHFKTETKKKNIPLVCSKASSSCFYKEYVKIMGIKDCKDCYAYKNTN